MVYVYGSGALSIVLQICMKSHVTRPISLLLLNTDFFSSELRSGHIYKTNSYVHRVRYTIMYVCVHVCSYVYTFV